MIVIADNALLIDNCFCSLAFNFKNIATGVS